MLSLSGAALLGLSAASVLTWDLGLGTEARGYAMAPEGRQATGLDLVAIDPRGNLGLTGAGGQWQLRAGYAPEIYFAARTGSPGQLEGARAFHTAGAGAAWRPDPRWGLALGLTGASGYRVVSPLVRALPGPVPEAGGGGDGAPAAPSPPLQPSAGTRSATYRSAGVGGSADVEVAARWRLGLSAGLTAGGGVGEAGRAAFPQERSARTDARARWTAGPFDTLTFGANASHTAFRGGAEANLLGANLRWDRTLTPRWSAFLGAGTGLSSTRFLSPDARDLAGALPAAEAGAAWNGSAPAGPGLTRGWNASVRLGVAPTIDVYAQRAVTRGEVAADAAWQSGTGLRLNASAARASTIASGAVGPSTGQGQLGAWWLVGRQAGVGVFCRVGWQSTPDPAGAHYQWATGVSVGWPGREIL